jgi:hypothetical protein
MKHDARDLQLMTRQTIRAGSKAPLVETSLQTLFPVNSSSSVGSDRAARGLRVHIRFTFFNSGWWREKILWSAAF